MTKEQILQHLHQLLEGRPEISFAYLHGSFLSGLAYHDIDVAFYLTPPVADPFDYAMSISVELTRALHQPIDVQVLNNSSLSFQHQVLQGKLLFTRNETQLTDFIEDVASEYMAFAHFLPDYLEAVTT